MKQTLQNGDATIIGALKKFLRLLLLHIKTFLKAVFVAACPEVFQ